MVFQKMKRPQRDFVVEIKSSRRQAKSTSSIWGSVDLKAHTAEVEDQLRAADDSTARQDSIEVASETDSSRLGLLPLPETNEPNDRQDVSAKPSTIQQKAPSPENTQGSANIGEPVEAGTGGKSQPIDYGPQAIADVEQRTASGDSPGSILEPLATAVESSAASEGNSKTAAKSRKRPVDASRIAKKNETAFQSIPGRDSGLAGMRSGDAGKNLANPRKDGKARSELARLEAENRHLKKLFADKLRKENAELKRKLGFS